MGTNRNRRAGHGFEREVVKMLKDRGWDAHTARYASRMLDDAGVDIAGDYPRLIQCKATATTPNMRDLLETTMADTIFWRKMIKNGERFYQSGDFAILPLEDFLDIIDELYKKEEP